MTASRALNQSGYVSQHVRQRVLKAAVKLEYRPNMVARQFKSQHLSAIGILLPDIANRSPRNLKMGSKMSLTSPDIARLLQYPVAAWNRKLPVFELADHRVDGLIVATRGTTMGDEVLKNLARQGIPTVTIGRPVKIAGMDSVTADHWQGAFDVVSHLISLGHSRIGFIGISPSDRLSLRRYRGIRGRARPSRD